MPMLGEEANTETVNNPINPSVKPLMIPFGGLLRSTCSVLRMFSLKKASEFSSFKTFSSSNSTRIVAPVRGLVISRWISKVLWSDGFILMLFTEKSGF